MASETLQPPPHRYRAAVRFLFRSLTLRGSSFLLALMAVTTGTTLTAAMLTLEADLGAKMSRELRRYGPNLLVTPATDSPAGGAAPSLDETSVRLAISTVSPGGAGVPLLFSPILIAAGWVRASDAETMGAEGAPPAAGSASLPSPELPDAIAREGLAATIVGADFGALHRMHPAWRIEGAWPSEAGHGCLVGASLAQRAGLLTGESVTVIVAPVHPTAVTRAATTAPLVFPSVDAAPRHNSGSGSNAASGNRSTVPSPVTSSLKIAGILSTGESEDEQVIVPLAFLQDATGLSGRISLAALAIDGGSDSVERIARALEPALPGATANVLHQVAAAQGAILGKLGRMMVLLTSVVVALSGLCFTTTLMAIVIEREGEIGLMRSIGAGDGEILTMFFGEAGLLGLLGGLIGFMLGAFSARLIGTSLFDAAVEPRAAVFALVVAGSVLLCLLSVLLPLRRALRIQPAAALRGD